MDLVNLMNLPNLRWVLLRFTQSTADEPGGRSRITTSPDSLQPNGLTA